MKIIELLGVMMKSFFLMMCLCGFIFADETYTIEVISAEEKSEVTQDFMQKVIDTGLPYFDEVSEGTYKVFVGEYLSKDDAEKALIGIKKEISEDAFVYEQSKEEGLSPEMKMQQVMVMAKARTLKKMSKVKVEEKKLDTVEPIKIVIREVEVSVVEPEVKEVPKEKVKPKEQYCKDSKTTLREAQISDAIAFYKNSSYYTFSK